MSILKTILCEAKKDLTDEEKQELLKRARGSYFKSAVYGTGGGYLGGGAAGAALVGGTGVGLGALAKNQKLAKVAGTGGAGAGFVAGANIGAPIGLGTGIVKNAARNIGARSAKSDKVIKRAGLKASLIGGASGASAAFADGLRKGVSKRELATRAITGGIAGLGIGGMLGRSYTKGAKKYQDEKDYYLKAKSAK